MRLLPRLFDHTLCNDDLLDLGRSFINSEQPDVAIEPFDAIVGDSKREAEAVQVR